MKTQYLFIIFFLVFLIGCAKQVKKEFRLEESFPYVRPLYIEYGGKEHCSNTPDMAGNIVFSKESVDIEIGEGTDKSIEKCSIRTVTYEKEPNEILYRTNKGNIYVTLQNDSIKMVHWVGGGFSILFNRQDPPQKINTSIPLPIDKPKPGWKRVKIENVGTIDLPPEMEIQGQEFIERAEPSMEKLQEYWDIEFSKPTLIFQPNGVNSNNPDALKKYSRVMYETFKGTPSEYQRLTETLAISNTDLIDLDKEIHNQIINEFSRTALRIIEWYPVKTTVVNGMPAILISYKRQLKNEPYVNVKMYRFQDYDKMHSLTLSYRIEEKDLWAAPLDGVLNSFRITKFN